MEFCCVIILSIAITVTANTGSAIKPSQQDTCSVPVDVITELQTLRSLQNQDSKITLDLGKQVMDLQKELHELRTQSSTSTQELKAATEKQVEYFQKEIHQLRTQYASSIQENQKLNIEIEALRSNLSELEYKSKEIETIRLNLSQVEQKSNEIEEWKNVTSSAIADLSFGVNRKPTGAVFTRWGRTTCPANTSELVYSGKYKTLFI